MPAGGGPLMPSRQLIILLATLGCASRAAAPPVVPAVPDCLLVPGSEQAPARLTVGVPGPVRPPELQYPSLGFTDLLVRQHLRVDEELDCHGRPAADPAGRRYRVDTLSDSTMVLVRDPLAGNPARIEIRAVPADGRDWLDAGIDLLVTDDPNTLDYAAAKPEFTVVPLPWSRTFRLRIPGAALDRLPDGVPPAGFGEALAREAVRVEARAVPPPEAPVDSCLTLPPAPAPAARRTATIVFIRDDRTAQELATRLVVMARAPGGEWLRDLLAAGGPRQPLSATGVPADRFGDLLGKGEDAGYVLAEPDRAWAPGCEDLRSISPAEMVREPGVSIPLVQTRYRVAVRRGVGGARVTAAGLLWLGGSP